MSIYARAIRLASETFSNRWTLIKGSSLKERYMQYLLLIYEQEASWNAISDGEKQKIYGQYMDLVGDMKKAGTYVGGNQLQPVATASTVRVRNGKKAVTDGPFAETKEQLGGYFLVEAKDLDEALGIAARIPGAGIGSIEVRPVVNRT
jgi:hypothetical protein